MQHFNINDQEYAVQIHQQKDELGNLLLLHGFMGDHRVFDHLIDNLTTFCNPITVDLLGFGESSKPDNPKRYKEEYQIDDIVSLIKKLSLSSLHLYGYSMGGRLALKTTLAHRDLFNGLILESTTCGITDSGARKKRRQADVNRAQKITENFQKFLSQWKDLDLFTSPIPPDQFLSRKYHQIQSEQSPSALSASLHGFGTGTMSPACGELTELDLPVLLIAGSADKKYQSINQYLAEQLPNATFLSIKAGHRVHLNNPQVLASELQNFLAEL